MRRHTFIAIFCLVLAWTAISAEPLHAQGRGVRTPYFAQLGPYLYGRAYDTSASLRIDVTPRDAQVFIDGYLAGTVDDFDGFFQRLHVEPGGHEITLFKEGYGTVRQQLYLEPGKTLKVRYTLKPLGPGDQQEPRPTPRTAPPERRGPGPRGGGPPFPRDRNGSPAPR